MGFQSIKIIFTADLIKLSNIPENTQIFQHMSHAKELDNWD